MSDVYSYAQAKAERVAAERATEAAALAFIAKSTKRYERRQRKAVTRAIQAFLKDNPAAVAIDVPKLAAAVIAALEAEGL